MINITRRFHDAVLKVAGGATNLMPKVTVTVVNPTANDIMVTDIMYEYIDGFLVYGIHHLIKAGESKVIEAFVTGDPRYNGFTETYDTIAFACWFPEGVDENSAYYYGEPSDLVNCEDTGDIIDPTKPVSFTATLTLD